MKFILTYDGRLKSAQSSEGKVERAHRIRSQLHPQLKRLWDTHEFLSVWEAYPSDYVAELPLPDQKAPSIIGNDRKSVRDFVPDFHRRGSFRFLPLTRKGWFLHCQLKILFLRREPPGAVTSKGDLDNRMKLLIDALKIPDTNQIGGLEPQAGQDPFYVLMEDDALLTALSVDTQMLLEPPKDGDNDAVRLIIEVSVTPYRATLTNLSLA